MHRFLHLHSITRFRLEVALSVASKTGIPCIHSQELSCFFFPSGLQMESESVEDFLASNIATLTEPYVCAEEVLQQVCSSCAGAACLRWPRASW